MAARRDRVRLRVRMRAQAGVRMRAQAGVQVRAQAGVQVRDRAGFQVRDRSGPRWTDTSAEHAGEGQSLAAFAFLLREPRSMTPIRSASATNSPTEMSPYEYASWNTSMSGCIPAPAP